MMTGGEERCGGGPFAGGYRSLVKNANRKLKLRPTQEMEGEACTGGGARTGVEKRGLYRRW